MKKLILSLASLFTVMAILLTSIAFKGVTRTPKPKNIILLIGDGMGLSQMSSAYFYGESEPNFSRFPVIGLSRTSSSSHKITDSAAGATAFSAGKKTYNGAIGVDDDKKPLETLVEYFEKKDWSNALIATSSITHATPASFYAHVDSRKKEYKIAGFMPESGVDFFAGGGQKFFYKKKGLIDKMEKAGYLLDTAKLPAEGPLDPTSKYGFLLAEDGMPRMLDGRGDFLPHATSLALDYLKLREKPFFMMIEGSQIDWGGHANNGNYIVTEVQDFDQTIGAVLDFAEKDGNTLVIVTADHETGGFTLASEEKKIPFMGKQSDYNSLRHGFSTGGHSATMVPVLAYGPGAENFAGIYQNTAIHEKIVALTR